MKMVRIVGSYVDYPPKCACCLSAASKTLPIRKEDLKRLALAAVVGVATSTTDESSSIAGRLRSSRAVDIPYCSQCLAHVTWARLGGWVGVALSALVYAFFGAMLAGLFHFMLSLSAEDPESEASLSVVMTLCILPALALAFAQVRFRPSGRLGRQHTPGGKDAVEIARFSSDAIVLKCHNEAFAAELVAANKGAAYSGVS